MRRPYKRAKLISEMTDDERKLVEDYLRDAHPTNIPDDLEKAWWDIDPKNGKAGWIAGYIF